MNDLVRWQQKGHGVPKNAFELETLERERDKEERENKKRGLGSERQETKIYTTPTQHSLFRLSNPVNV